MKSWYTVVDESNKVTIDNNSSIFVQEPSPTYVQAQPTNSNSIETVEKIDLVEIRRQAENILKSAKEDAKASADTIIAESLAKANDEAKAIKDSLIEEANNAVELIKEQAKNEGYEAGINSAKDQAAAIVQEAEKIKEDAHVYKEELIKNIEPEMISLITSILDSLIGVEKELNPNIVSFLIKNGLEKVSINDDIIVHVSTEDFPHLDKNNILSSMETMVNVDFIEDPTLRKSSCIIETSLGNIDCSLDTQYQSLRKNLNYILKNR